MAKTMNELMEILTASKNESKKKKSKLILCDSKEKKDRILASYPRKYYAGYVKRFPNKPIAVSDNKNLLKEYMENHRFIKPNHYEIEIINNLSDQEVFIMYNDQLLVEYNGYYLPSIDTMMIDFYKVSMKTELYNTIKSLSKISLFVKESKLVYDFEKDELYNALRILTKFMKTDKIMDEIEHEALITNSIIFEDVQSYMQDLACFNEMMEMHQRYEYQIYKDDDFNI